MSHTPPAITWLGHATTLLELDGLRVLTDPVIRNRIGPLKRIAPEVQIGALGHIDYVLLSHLHADHADVRSLRDLGRAVPIIGPRAAAAWLKSRGLENVRELAPGEAAEFGSVSFLATPAVHDRRRRPLGPQADPIGYLIRGTISSYFAGDTDLFDEMAELKGCVDVALLPVWGWGPTLGEGHLDPDRAAQAAALIAPRVAIPIHWGTFALGWPARPPSDPWLPARQFAALSERYAPAVEVRLLAPGERTQL